MDIGTLPIRVDKSHLVTIGERLYTESIELIRELVNNAYDADATEVSIKIADQEVRVHQQKSTPLPPAESAAGDIHAASHPSAYPGDQPDERSPESAAGV